MSEKFLNGVVSFITKDGKTAAVLIRYTFMHPKYRKVIRRNKKYLCHIPDGFPTDLESYQGKNTMIKETRPISKRKNFVLFKVI